MKHPFWIVNSLLIFLILISLAFIFMSKVEISEREDIAPRKYSAIASEHSVQINISKIYENDLFGTYRKEIPLPESEVIPLPPAPEPTQATIPPQPKPQFLDPLDVSLKGITILGSDPTKTRAIIADNKTQKESNYKVGDNIEDGQLIRIFSNKVVLLRANGQQEVLYLREQDAKRDPLYSLIDEWNKVVSTVDGSTYQINIKEFSARVKSLAQLIDMLDLTTAYKQGESVGGKIGQLPEKSFGTYIGLQSGDIITAINGIDATTIDNRLMIYKKIVGMRNGDTIQITLQRNKQEIKLRIILKDSAEIKEDTPQEEMIPEVTKPQIPEQQDDEIEVAKKNKEQSTNEIAEVPRKTGAITVLTHNEKQRIIAQGTKYKPTINKIQLDEKQYMLAKGRKPTHL